MKKTLVIAFLVMILQLAVLFGGIWLSISLRGDCSFTPGQFASWECTKNTDPVAIPIIASLVLPSFLAKAIFSKLGKKVSWKRIFITHIIVIVLVWAFLIYIEPPVCSCGEPGLK